MRKHFGRTEGGLAETRVKLKLYSKQRARRAPDELIEQKTATGYGEVSEWLTKCASILDARRAVSQRQE